MKFRRGSTSSPMRMVKISSTPVMSSSLTCNSVRVFRIHRRFPQLIGIHFAQSFVALDAEALLADAPGSPYQLGGRPQLLFLSLWP